MHLLERKEDEEEEEGGKKDNGVYWCFYFMWNRRIKVMGEAFVVMGFLFSAMA